MPSPVTHCNIFHISAACLRRYESVRTRRPESSTRQSFPPGIIHISDPDPASGHERDPAKDIVRPIFLQLCVCVFVFLSVSFSHYVYPSFMDSLSMFFY